MVNNPSFYGQSTTGTPNQIEDGQDFPHTGIIKALSDGLGQNYAISGFNITAGTNQYTQIDVSAGVIIRDGKRVGVDAVSDLTMTFTTANGYHLLVVDSSNALVLRAPSAVDKVADVRNSTTTPTGNDTVVAVITYKGSSTSPDFQYLTVDKNENSATIGYSNSGTYAESMKISGDTDRTSFQSMEQNSDIRFILGHNTADEKFEIMTDDAGDTELTPVSEVFSVDGTGVTKVKSLSLGTAAELTITESSDDITIKNTVSDKDIIFNINDGGSDSESMRIDGDINQVKIKSLGVGSAAELTITESSDDITIKNTVSDKDIIFNANDGGSDTEIMRIDGSESRVGIGTNSPATKLDVKGDGTFSRSGDLGVTTTVTIEGARNATGSNFAVLDFKNYDSHGPTSYVGARISALNEATGVNDGSLVFSTNNANAGITERMRIKDSGEVIVSGEIEIDGNLNHDGTNVGFFGTAPASKTSVAVLGSVGALLPSAEPSAPALADTQTKIDSIQQKLDALINALSALGLV